jgi:hypothetical protein
MDDSWYDHQIRQLPEAYLIYMFQGLDLFPSSGSGPREGRSVLSWTHRKSKSRSLDVQRPRSVHAKSPTEYGSFLSYHSGVHKTKNNSGASIFFFLQIRAKKTTNQTEIKLHILKCDLKTSNLLINTRLD